MNQASTLVSFKGVSKNYGSTSSAGSAKQSSAHLAIDNLTLEILRGEILGVIGESGAGKSTLLQLINGLVTPSAGSITVAGQDVSTLDGAELRALRRDIGVLFQGVDLMSSATVARNVALPLQLGRATRPVRLTRAQESQQIADILEFVGLTHRAHHYPAQLSGGEQQRVGLARALVTQPALLLCDEPTSSLDSRTTSGVLDVLARARTELGATIVLVTHDLDVVKAICDRAALMDAGQLREHFDVKASDYNSLPSYHEQVKRELME